MKIIIANDHTGIELKKFLIKNLIQKDDIKILDLGVNNTKTSNYAQIGINLGKQIISKKDHVGILICGTGIGISIAANKVQGIRCALCNDIFSARLSKEHNNANVIAIGARIVAKEYALAIVETFLNTKYVDQRHNERIEVINNYDK